MNPYSLIGFILAAIVLVYGVFNSGSSASTFLNEHAFMIVVGGSIASSSIAFRLDRMFLLFRVFFYGVVKGNKVDFVKLIQEMMVLAEASRNNSLDFQKAITKIRDPFLKEALALGLDGIMDRGRLEKILKARVTATYHRYLEDALKFKTVGRYPPAFGLMGTTLGMIALLQKLGEANGQKLIGPAMAVALVATFLGLSLANLVFSPIAENLMESAKERRLKNTIIVEGVLLILDKTNPLVLVEELNSFLLPSERITIRRAPPRPVSKEPPGRAA